MPDAATVATAAVPVSVVGSTLFSKLTAAGVWTAVATLIGLYLRSRIPMRKLKIEAEEQLRIDLMGRMGKMEEDHASEKDSWMRKLENFDQKLELVRTQYEAKIEAERAQHEREIRNMRHRMNNLAQSLEMVLVLIESNGDNPDKVKEAARRVREMRAKQELTEAHEAAVSSGVRVAVTTAAVGVVGDPNSIPDPDPAPAPTPSPAPARRRRRPAQP